MVALEAGTHGVRNSSAVESIDRPGRTRPWPRHLRAGEARAVDFLPLGVDGLPKRPLYRILTWLLTRILMAKQRNKHSADIKRVLKKKLNAAKRKARKF